MQQGARGFWQGGSDPRHAREWRAINERPAGNARPLWQLEMNALHSTVQILRQELQSSRAQEMRARYCALHDDLTGLPNRRYFRERVGSALTTEASPWALFSLLILDLDRFKSFNDTYGHAAGDHLLRIVGARITGALRAEDLVSRLGGDEFACLITGVGKREELTAIAAKLFQAISAPCAIGSKIFSIRPSIGIAVCPSANTAIEVLMNAADGAMYAAKRKRTMVSFAEPLPKSSSLYIVTG